MNKKSFVSFGDDNTLSVNGCYVDDAIHHLEDLVSASSRALQSYGESSVDITFVLNQFVEALKIVREDKLTLTIPTVLADEISANIDAIVGLVESVQVDRVSPEVRSGSASPRLDMLANIIADDINNIMIDFAKFVSNSLRNRRDRRMNKLRSLVKVSYK